MPNIAAPLTGLDDDKWHFVMHQLPSGNASEDGISFDRSVSALPVDVTHAVLAACRLLWCIGSHSAPASP